LHLSLLKQIFIKLILITHKNSEEPFKPGIKYMPLLATEFSRQKQLEAAKPESPRFQHKSARQRILTEIPKYSQFGTLGENPYF
jgi:hypothetical protein